MTDNNLPYSMIERWYLHRLGTDGSRCRWEDIEQRNVEACSQADSGTEL